MESLILAQRERWRRALYMQVEGQQALSSDRVLATGGRVSNAWATYP